MKRKFGILAAIFALGAATVEAQNIGELYQLSSTTYSLVNARSGAMGGAFTSLGANAISASQNPAGIGMYNSSDFGFNLSVLPTNVDSKSGDESFREALTKVPLTSLTAILNVYKGNGSVSSLNFGFTYNQLQNYSRNQYVAGGYQSTSIADVWMQNLNNIGANPGDLSANGDRAFNTFGVDMWGSVLAYKNDLINEIDDNSNIYSLIPALYNGDRVAPILKQQIEGTKNDYAFTFGVNANSKVYIGATMSYQEYKSFSKRYYTEYADVDNNRGDLDYTDYLQELDVRGSGFSFKTGITLLPAEGLRIGLAVHAPVLYHMEERYYEDLVNKYQFDNQEFYSNSPDSYSKYTTRTPTVLLAGVSYTIGKFGILSFDYDRTWYNQMRFKDMEGYERDKNESIKESYQPANNYRVGGEFRVSPSVSLRAGYAYYGNGEVGAEEGVGCWNNYSCGLGYSKNGFYFDLAYVNMNTKLDSQKYFSYYYSGGNGGDYVIESENDYTTSITRHNVMITMGFRF